MNYLNKILSDLSFDKEAQKEVLKAYSLIKDTRNIKIILNQYKNEKVDFLKLVSAWRVVLKKYYIGNEIGDLMFCLLLCEKLENLYQKHNLSHKLFIETMSDLRYKAVECKLVKKKWGIFVTSWYSDFFKLKTFSFGRLQFQFCTFLVDYQDECVTLKRGQPCLGIHIPRTGEPLDIKEVKKSIARAKRFFKPYFKKYILFSCSSWLLYKKTLEFVGKDSNIYRFSKLFNLIDTIEVSQQEDEMWRLFDSNTKDLNKLKANTSLRKKYLKYLKSGGKIGLGLGYFIYRF
ncbi:MAG: acyltransferase domain-containing protein [Bacilli bacterium]|nr:acyltransferase domain-containing protein [Bacilli bacterium]